MTPLEQIKAEVIKCCPEIMELKGGCEIKIEMPATDPQDGGYLENGVIINFSEKEGRMTIYFPDSDYAETFSTERKEYITEILGSPIKLHHILRTYIAGMKLDSWIDPMPYHYSGMTNEEYELERKRMKALKEEDGILEIIARYNLSLPLASQSEETLKFLAELLSKK